MLHIGDFVTARLVDGINNERRQGAIVELYDDGTMLVEGGMGQYICYQEGATKVERRYLW